MFRWWCYYVFGTVRLILTHQAFVKKHNFLYRKTQYKNGQDFLDIQYSIGQDNVDPLRVVALYSKYLQTIHTWNFSQLLVADAPMKFYPRNLVDPLSQQSHSGSTTRNPQYGYNILKYFMSMKKWPSIKNIKYICIRKWGLQHLLTIRIL